MSGMNSEQRLERKTRMRAVEGIIEWIDGSKSAQIEFSGLNNIIRLLKDELKETGWEPELNMIVDRTIKDSVDTLPVDDIDGLEEYIDMIIGVWYCA